MLQKNAILYAIVFLLGCFCAYLYSISNSRFVKSEILFGRNHDNNVDELSEEAWEMFLEKNVTPIFPHGFTVTSSKGQMLDSNNKIEKQRNFGLFIIHKNDFTNKANIDKIVHTFKKTYPDLQVIKFQHNVEVELYNR